MILPKYAELGRFIGTALLAVPFSLTTACSDTATAPDLPSTASVSIVVSCDVAVQQDGGHWRVSYCTLSLGGGLSGSSLIIPAETGIDRREMLLRFGACVNRKTSTEQHKCFPLLDP